jgi:hypothetical protein
MNAKCESWVCRFTNSISGSQTKLCIWGVFRKLLSYCGLILTVLNLEIEIYGRLM